VVGYSKSGPRSANLATSSASGPGPSTREHEPAEKLQREEQAMTMGRGGTYIIILGEAEELADLGGALGAETLGVDDVGEAGDVALALLHDAEGKHGQVHGDDAAADRLALTLTSASGSVAGVALGEQEAHTGWVHNTLLHGEALLVVASSDAEDVALELVADAVAWDLGAHSVRVVRFCPGRVLLH
jgi:hypothetical protein